MAPIRPDCTVRHGTPLTSSSMFWSFNLKATMPWIKLVVGPMFFGQFEKFYKTEITAKEVVVTKFTRVQELLNNYCKTKFTN